MKGLLSSMASLEQLQQAPAEGAGERVLELPLAQVKTRAQSRKRFRHIDSLAESIIQRGLIQPITVFAQGDHYVIVSGERRYRAFQLLEEPTIPAIVRDVSQGLELTGIELIENIQRDALTPFEIAHALESYREQGLSQVQIGQELGYSQKWVSLHMALADSDSRLVALFEQEAIVDAETLNSLRKVLAKDDKAFTALASRAVAHGLSRAEVNRTLAALKHPPVKAAAVKKATKPAWFSGVEGALKPFADNGLGLKTKFDASSGQVKLELQLDPAQADDLEALAAALARQLRGG